MDSTTTSRKKEDYYSFSSAPSLVTVGVDVLLLHPQGRCLK